MWSHRLPKRSDGHGAVACTPHNLSLRILRPRRVKRERVFPNGRVPKGNTQHSGATACQFGHLPHHTRRSARAIGTPSALQQASDDHDHGSEKAAHAEQPIASCTSAQRAPASDGMSPFGPVPRTATPMGGATTRMTQTVITPTGVSLRDAPIAIIKDGTVANAIAMNAMPPFASPASRSQSPRESCRPHRITSDFRDSSCSRTDIQATNNGFLVSGDIYC